MERRTLLALTLSFVLLMAYQVFLSIYYPQQPQQVQEGQMGEATAPPTAPDGSPIPIEGVAPTQGVANAPAAPSAADGAASTATAAAKPASVNSKTGKLVTFDNGVVQGALLQSGARLVDMRFLNFLDEQGEKGQPIRFINDTGNKFFFGESGFIGTPGIAAPEENTPWQVVSTDEGKKSGQLVLKWDNGAGLTFEKRLAFTKDSYLFTITDRVINSSSTQAPLYHYTQFKRVNPGLGDEDPAMAVADFQGPMGFLDDERHQYPYEDLQGEDQSVKASNGWSGFSDKYFLAAIVPGTNKVKKNFYFDFDAPTHRVGVVAPRVELQPGQQYTTSTQLYVGPKEIQRLEDHGLGLERAIDYGWFHFLAVPLVKLLLFFYSFLGNYGLAIILLTILIKAIFFPLANKSYRSMSAMKKLQPKIEELKKLHDGDRQKLNQEMMKLYQDNKVNPLGGCLPILVQIPVFFALYKTLFLSVEMRHAPFYFWINDLSAMDPLYILPLLMGVSMFVQSKLNPAPADPIQAKIMMFLPVMFTFLFLTFPAGLVLYWLVNNVLSIFQQAHIMKQAEAAE